MFVQISTAASLVLQSAIRIRDQDDHDDNNNCDDNINDDNNDIDV